MQRQVDLAHLVWSADIADFESTYRGVAEAGFGSVVLGARLGQFDLRVRQEAREAGRILESLGLKAPACHGLDEGPGGLNGPDNSVREALVQAHVDFMANAAELGSLTYVVHIGPALADQTKEASWDRVRRSVDELARQAEALGIIVALENGLPNYLMTNEELLDFVADYGHDWVGICYDSGHAHVTGDAAAVLRALAPYVVTVHLHDNDGIADQHLVPGQGTVDWPGVVAALAECGRLRHAETEAANSAHWAPTPEVLGQRELYERYRAVLNPPGSGVCYR